MNKARIRRFRETDLDDLYALLSDPEVMRHLEPPFTRVQAAAFLKTQGLAEEPRILAVEDAGEHFVGYVICHAYDETGMEIGWVLGRDFWHRGIADELTEQLVRMAASAGKDAVIECVPEQAASRRIAQKHGFQRQPDRDGLAVYVRPCR